MESCHTVASTSNDYVDTMSEITMQSCKDYLPGMKLKVKVL